MTPSGPAEWKKEKEQQKKKKNNNNNTYYTLTRHCTDGGENIFFPILPGQEEDELFPEPHADNLRQADQGLPETRAVITNMISIQRLQ